MRQATEPAAWEPTDDVVCDLGVRVPDLDGLPTCARRRGIGQELDLAGFLERNEEMDRRLNRVGRHKYTVILLSWLLARQPGYHRMQGATRTCKITAYAWNQNRVGVRRSMWT